MPAGGCRHLAGASTGAHCACEGAPRGSAVLSSASVVTGQRLYVLDAYISLFR